MLSKLESRDYHMGNGKGLEKNKNKGNKEDTEKENNESTVTSDVYNAGTIESYDEEITDDITTEPVKENPYCFRHYRMYVYREEYG